MSQKRKLEEYHDPDYKQFSNNSLINQQSTQTKRIKKAALEPSERLEKIRQIIKREYQKELQLKENEINKIDNNLVQCKKLLQRVRYAVVSNYYNKKNLKLTNEEIRQEIKPAIHSGSIEVTSTQLGIEPQQQVHPSLKKLLGKYPVDYNEILKIRPMRQAAKTATTTIKEKLRTKKEERLFKNSINYTQCHQENATTSNSNVEEKVPRYIEPMLNEKPIQQLNSSRGRNHSKHLIVVGNTSKYIGDEKSIDGVTHKWLVYVRTKTEQSINDIVTKVRFFLHPSYKPNDVVEVCSPPFQLSRRGWGEFPIRVQLYFKPETQQKPLQIIHNLILDRKHTGIQTMGAETIVELWLVDNYTNIIKREDNINDLLPTLIKNEINNEYNNINNDLFDIKNSDLFNDIDDSSMDVPSDIKMEQNNKEVDKSKIDVKDVLINNEIITETINSSINSDAICHMNGIDTSVIKINKEEIKEEPAILENENKKIDNLVNDNKVVNNNSNKKLLKYIDKNGKMIILGYVNDNILTKNKSLIQIKTISGNNAQQPPPLVPMLNLNKINNENNIKIVLNNNIKVSSGNTTLTTIAKTPAKTSSVNLFNHPNTSNDQIPLSSTTVVTSSNKIINPLTTVTTVPSKSTNLVMSAPGNTNAMMVSTAKQSVIMNKNVVMMKNGQVIFVNNTNNNNNKPSNIQINSPQKQQLHQQVIVKPKTQTKQVSLLKFRSANSLLKPINQRQETNNNNNNLSLENSRLLIEHDYGCIIAKSQPEMKTTNNCIITQAKLLPPKINNNYNVNLLNSNNKIITLNSTKNNNKIKVIINNNNNSIIQNTNINNNIEMKSIFPNKLKKLLNSTINNHNNNNNDLNIVKHSNNNNILNYQQQQQQIKIINYYDNLLNKFKNQKFLSIKTAIDYLLKNVPLVSVLVNTDNNYRKTFNFTIDKFETFNLLKPIKQRCNEFMRAKFIKRLLKKCGDFNDNDLWTVKEIILYARIMCYTPKLSYINQNILNKDNLSELVKNEIKNEENNFIKNTLTYNHDVYNWLHKVSTVNNKGSNSSNKTSISTNNNEDEDDEIIDVDNININDNNKVNKNNIDNILENNPGKKVMLIEKSLINNGNLINQMCNDIKIKLQPEEIVPDVLHSTSQRLLIQVLHSFVEDLLRQSHAFKFNNNNNNNLINDELIIKPNDIINVLSKRNEFDFLTNKYFGVALTKKNEDGA